MTYHRPRTIADHLSTTPQAHTFGAHPPPEPRPSFTATAAYLLTIGQSFLTPTRRLDTSQERPTMPRHLDSYLRAPFTVCYFCGTDLSDEDEALTRDHHRVCQECVFDMSDRDQDAILDPDYVFDPDTHSAVKWA